MAECSYARCLQERRLIKRELMKWSKDMLHIVGLERVAEELMGRRKWKHYQEALTRTQFNLIQEAEEDEDIQKSKINCSNKNNNKLEEQHLQQQQQQQQQQEQEQEEKLEEAEQQNHRQIKIVQNQAEQQQEQQENDKLIVNCNLTSTEFKATSHNNNNNLIKNTSQETTETEREISTSQASSAAQFAEKDSNLAAVKHSPITNKPLRTTPPPEPIDWTPSDKCNFCINGRLLTVNAKGELVAETGPTVTSTPPSSTAIANLGLVPGGISGVGGVTPQKQQHQLDSDSDSCKSEIFNNSIKITAKIAKQQQQQQQQKHHYHHNKNNIKNTHSSKNTNNNTFNLNKLITSHLKELPSTANMTSMDSMAAQLAAIQTISELHNNINLMQLAKRQQQQQQQQQQHEEEQQQQNQHHQHQQQTINSVQLATTSELTAAAVAAAAAAAAISPLLKDSLPSPSDASVAAAAAAAAAAASAACAGEQPLDLSSKPSPNSSISGDLRAVRTKSSCATPTPSNLRRGTYSEDDLNSALQDIQEGKLGTRKAAVLYNIPRSTLRNKIYKLALDAKRNNTQASEEHLQHLQRVLEREISGDEAATGAMNDDDDEDDEDDEHEDDGNSNASSSMTSSSPLRPPMGAGSSATGNMSQPANAYEDLASRIAAAASTAQLRKLVENNSSDMGAGSGDDADNLAAAISASPKLASSLRAQSNTPTSSSHLHLTHPQSSSTPASSVSPQPASLAQPPALQPAWIDTNMLLQTLLLTAGVLQPKLDETLTVRDLINALLLNSGGVLMNDLANAPAAAAIAAASLNANDAAGSLNNGKPNMLDQRLLLQQLQLQQQQQQQQQQMPTFRHRLAKSDTPETISSMDTSEVCDDPAAAILKIPSFKPIAGTSSSSPSLLGNSGSGSGIGHHNHNSNNNNSNSSTNRNGDSPHSSSPMLAAAVAAAAANSNSHGGGGGVASSSGVAYRHNNNLLSASPPSFREVMANSIHRTINEQASKDAQAAAASMLGLGGDPERNNGNSGSGDYKKPSISVAKIIGGTDTSRFGSSPNLLASHHQPSHAHLPHHHVHSRHSHHLSQQEAAALAAGKGTRPKRGKYRNYDRDSLVEAVKAVQRGEMSVHRAGSYYGVPHSTLEYKVKERHLMRPRKREPKPQPGLDGLSSTSSSKNSSLDKLKTSASSATNSKLSNALKNNAQSAAAAATVSAPNGIKLPIFDTSQLPYQSHMFWQTPANAANFPGLDFNRAAAAAAATQGAVGNVNQEFLKSHIQEAMRLNAAAAAAVAANSSTSPLGGQNSHHHHQQQQQHHGMPGMKSALEVVENIYDGIIRKTLDRKSADVNPNGGGGGGGAPGSGNGNALLDQLLVKKSPLPFTNNRNNDYAAACSSSIKRSAGSPIPYTEIKRERASPERGSGMSGNSSSSDDDDQHLRHHHHHHHQHALSRNAMLSHEDVALGLEHNNNNNSNKCNNNSGGLLQQQQQQVQRSSSRITSRDSETDASSIKSERSNSTSHLSLHHLQQQQQQQHHHHQHHLHHNNNSNSSVTNTKMMDLNGSVAKLEPATTAMIEGNSSSTMTNTSLGTTATSILHEKLAQIKAEQTDHEEQANL